LKLLLQNKKPAMIFFSQHSLKNGIKYYERAKKKNFEGIMAKEINSPYYPGRRSGSWLKIKISKQQELIIIGMTAPKGSRSYFGSLLLGYYLRGKLKYAGNCGTGFTEATLAMLHKKASRYFTGSSPVTERIPVKGKVQWIRPELVCQVKFTEWTRSGSLRHPVYLGLRDDKDPGTITREKPTFYHE
jgi:bifunctional non-homologous end joining protein LigD